MPLGKKKARRLLEQAREARRAATMERMSCGSNDTVMTKTTTSNGTDYIRDKTRLYRDSWIIHPLDCIIEELEKHV